MSSQWHGGKGDKPRPESERGNYGRGYDDIDWDAREREKNNPPQPEDDPK